MTDTLTELARANDVDRLVNELIGTPESRAFYGTEAIAGKLKTIALTARREIEAARAAGAAEMQERCAKVAAGPYRNVSQYHEDSPYFGSDLTPDRSEFGRGRQTGRTDAATAIRSLT